jgi:hypothetical protein
MAIKAIKVGHELRNLDQVRNEIQEYIDVLFGRKPAPLEDGIDTLLELATAYYSRAKEIEAKLHQLESNGVILKGSKHYKYRTGELRSYLELLKAQVDLGSRRITVARLEQEQDEGYQMASFRN